MHVETKISGERAGDLIRRAREIAAIGRYAGRLTVCRFGSSKNVYSEVGLDELIMGHEGGAISAHIESGALLGIIPELLRLRYIMNSDQGLSMRDGADRVGFGLVDTQGKSHLQIVQIHEEDLRRGISYDPSIHFKGPLVRVDFDRAALDVGSHVELYLPQGSWNWVDGRR